jgi:hypothetical protein
MRWMIRNFFLLLSLIHVRVLVCYSRGVETPWSTLELASATIYHMNTKAASALIDLQVTADYGKEALNKRAWSATAKWTSAKTTVWRASLVSKCLSLSIPPVVLLLLALGVVYGISGGVFLALQNRGHNGLHTLLLVALIPSCLFPFSVAFTAAGWLTWLSVIVLYSRLDAGLKWALWAVFFKWAINNSSILLYMWYENMYLHMIADSVYRLRLW